MIPHQLGAAFALRKSIVLGAAVLLAACNGGPVQKSSSSDTSALSSSAAVESSSSVLSSSQPSSSSSLSSFEVSSESSSSVMSSSSQSSVEAIEKQVIVPRTECPPAPPEASHGSWEPHLATSDTDQYNTVRNFKELMVEQPVFDQTGYDLPWYFHKPFQADGNPEAKYPLVIYLHGLGESGNNYGDLWDNRHTTNFFASSNSLLTAEHQEQFPAYIVAPHCDCSQGTEWTNGAGRDWRFSESNMSRPERALNELIDHIVENYQVDPARIYVTGISMGGAGSWGLALRRPDLIAAAVPLSGHSPDRSTMQSLLDTKLPVWAHHAPMDENNPYDETKSDVDALAADGGCTFITSYPTVQDIGWELVDPGDVESRNGNLNYGGNDLNHTVWPRAYTNPDLWPWVFSVAQPTETQLVYPDEEGAGGFEGETLDAANHYDAPKASTAPTIDGQVDDVWNDAPWMAMSVAWTGFDNLEEPDSEQDYNGRYKVIWDDDYLYVLLEVIDDVIDTSANEYWNKDTVEIFLDEDGSGGFHQGSANAFAYHISHEGDVIDQVNVDGHVDVVIDREGTTSTWEIRIGVFDEQNNPVMLDTSHPTMGFTPSYIDNDTGGQRDHFMSSVDTDGHQNNQGFQNADVFGSLTLVE